MQPLFFAIGNLRPRPRSQIWNCIATNLRPPNICDRICDRIATAILQPEIRLQIRSQKKKKIRLHKQTWGNLFATGSPVANAVTKNLRPAKVAAAAAPAGQPRFFLNFDFQICDRFAVAKLATAMPVAKRLQICDRQLVASHLQILRPLCGRKFCDRFIFRLQNYQQPRLLRPDFPVTKFICDRIYGLQRPKIRSLKTTFLLVNEQLFSQILAAI